MLIIHLLVALKFRMSGVIPPRSYVLSWRKEILLYLYIFTFCLGTQQKAFEMVTGTLLCTCRLCRQNGTGTVPPWHWHGTSMAPAQYLHGTCTVPPFRSVSVIAQCFILICSSVHMVLKEHNTTQNKVWTDACHYNP
jgi:hypothetical protein